MCDLCGESREQGLRRIARIDELCRDLLQHNKNIRGGFAKPHTKDMDNVIMTERLLVKSLLEDIL